MPENREIEAKDIESKIDELSNQMNTMTQLEEDINSKFHELSDNPKIHAEELKILSKMGITSIDAIYAFDPGKHREKFMPNGPDGEPIQYDARNLVHNFYGIRHFMYHPAEALADGMKPFDAKAVEKLENT